MSYVESVFKSGQVKVLIYTSSKPDWMFFFVKSGGIFVLSLAKIGSEAILAESDVIFDQVGREEIKL